ncbi:translation initiation factor IF-2 [Elusimicrobiota bacterium]
MTQKKEKSSAKKASSKGKKTKEKVKKTAVAKSKPAKKTAAKTAKKVASGFSKEQLAKAASISKAEKTPKKTLAVKKEKPLKAVSPKKTKKQHLGEEKVHIEKKISEVEQKEVKPPVKHEEKPKAEEKHKEKKQAPVAVPAAEPKKEEVEYKGEIKINELVTIRDLSEKLNVNVGEILKKLLSMGTLATINQRLDVDVATLLMNEYGYKAKYESLYSEESMEEEKDDPAKLKPRSPVVTIMGHVDHGKTSLLDVMRSSKITEGEAGGITQHIGAYKVKTDKGQVTFLDTPGHEAFTAMRSRGAQTTDIVVLVVSAVDGIMPQTVEAIDHARAANVPIIVAVNKIDLPTANPANVKQELTKHNLIAEDWGGDTITVEVSAKQNINIDGLLEMILLKAEMMELKANPDCLARGTVVEAKLDSRRGSVATILVQKGTLHVGDNFVVGNIYGKVRAMHNEFGKKITDVVPSTPVEILGTNGTPQAGDKFVVVEQEFQARQIAEARRSKAREDAQRPRHHLSLEDVSAGKVKELRLVLKTDVQGSLGALSDSLERLSTSEIGLKIIHRGVGSITESDVALAAASDAMIIGFNIRPDSVVEKLAEKEGVSINIYRIIYEVISDITAAMEGMLEPHLKDKVIGKAQVKQVFKVSKAGAISGGNVLEGKMQRGAKIRLIRDNVIVHEGNISSLRRFKDDVKEVEKGYECGIVLEKYSDVKPGDIVECLIEEKITRKL